MDRGKWTHLGVSGISVENIREEFTGAGDARNDEAVYVIAIYNEEMGKVELIGDIGEVVVGAAEVVLCLLVVLVLDGRGPHGVIDGRGRGCLLYTSPSPRD